jgi:hypothetical protein
MKDNKLWILAHMFCINQRKEFINEKYQLMTDLLESYIWRIMILDVSSNLMEQRSDLEPEKLSDFIRCIFLRKRPVVFSVRVFV